MKVQKPAILVVDDEEKTRKILKINFQDRYRVLLAQNGLEAMNYLKHERVHLVLTDVRMPEVDGIELLQHIQQEYPYIPVVLITAFGTVDNAVQAMKMGAYDYITKPVQIAEIEKIIEKSIHYGQVLEENVQLKSRLKKYEGLQDIITANPHMQSLLDSVRQVSSTRATILIEGDSGTGKALFARAAHYLSQRAPNPFIEINCGAIPRDLLESELFGHERGAFTGAVQTKKGKFELADQGTLFLDEIGEMPLDLQVKLLHVIEKQTFTRVGGTQFIQTNARIVAATNRDLQEAVRRGDFRQDLYFRLKIVYIHVPPLRERPEDIPLLTQHFFRKHRELNAVPITTLSDEALVILQQYPWPGNVRELENVISQAMIFARDGEITADLLPPEIRDHHESVLSEVPLKKESVQKEKLQRTEKIINEVEYAFLSRLLRETGGNVTKAARLSGYDRRQIQNLMKKHGLNIENFKGE